MGKFFGMKNDDHQVLFGTMLVSAAVGLVAAFVLTLEKIKLLQDPDAVLSCSVNVVLNCASVIKTPQSSVFGFPNSLIGLIGYAVIITVAVAYFSGARPNKLFWQIANVFYALGAAFSYWLFFTSVYTIQILCPWCLLVTFVTTILLATITHYNIRENNFGVSKSVSKTLNSWLDKGYIQLLTASWIVILVALVMLKFGDGLFA